MSEGPDDQLPPLQRFKLEVTADIDFDAEDVADKLEPEDLVQLIIELDSYGDDVENITKPLIEHFRSLEIALAKGQL